VRERGDGTLHVVFKVPQKREPGVELTPRLPDGCAFESQESDRLAGTARIRVLEARCDAGPFAGRTLAVDGLADSRSGVLVRVELATGSVQSRMLDASEPEFVVAADPTRWGVVTSYLELGVEHLVTGYDHGLFLLALTFLLGWGRRLFWTLTLFTVGHSVTLALAALGWVAFPVAVVEASIALSIVAAASELAGNRHGWITRHPFATAAGFGLLHGMGFAGALAEVGLPGAEIPLALLGFNIGIEVGQILIVAGVLTVGAGLKAIGGLPSGRFLTAAGYGLGTVAAFWFWQRLGVFAAG
jgi:hypothetical protein